MATASMLAQPPPLNITSGNIAENFKIWKRQFEIYLRATKNDVPTVDGETKVSILYCVLGPMS